MLFSSLRQRLTNAPERLSSACRNSLDYRVGLIEKLISARISRRDALRLSLTATLAAPIFSPLARATSRFDIQVHVPHLVTITVANEVVFEVNARSFGPDAQIDFQQPNADEFSIRLRDAWLPGTRLGADFELVVSRGHIGWQAHLMWPALGYVTFFDFEPWLLGFPVATGALDVSKLLSRLDLAADTKAFGSAVFLPDWTLEIIPAPAIQFSLAPGKVLAGKMQLELIDADTPALLVDGSAVRTRLWIEGTLLSAMPVQLSRCQACFADGKVEALIEYRPDTPMAWAMESQGSVQNTGFIIPHALASGQMVGFATSQLRLVSLDAGLFQAQATLKTRSRWYDAPGIHIEVTALSTTLRDNSQLEQAKIDSFRVSRMIVALPEVDHAVFVRMQRPNGGAAQIDRLAWFEGLHPFGRSVPLDEFELHLSRGSDALQVVVRFRNVQLKVTGSSRQLLCAVGARLEFAFSSQHASEQALYITQLPGTSEPGAADTVDNFISDEEICQCFGQDAARCKQWLAGLGDQEYNVKRLEAIRQRRQQDSTAPTMGTAARFADASWLTFNVSPVNGTIRRLPLTLQALFDWAYTRSDHALSDPQPVLHPAALAVGTSLENQEASRGKNNQPAVSLSQATGEYATMIQAPYRLGLSPIGVHRWLAPPKMEEAPGRRELWTLRMERAALRAIWSPDYREGFWPGEYPHFPQPPHSFRAPLDGRDRHEIVALSSGFGEAAKLGTAQVVPYTFKDGRNVNAEVGLFIPKPILAQLLQLSAYGASLKLKANWAPPSTPTDTGALTVAFWDQNSQLGRDTRVIVEYKGFLFPLGLPATLVKDTQRRLVSINGSCSAHLVQRFYINVPALSRSTPMLQQPFDGRGWPFSTLCCQNFLSPDLAAPEECSLDGLATKFRGQQVFWPSVMKSGRTVPVDFPFEDPGTGVKARAPLLFIDNDIAHDRYNLAKVARAYRQRVEEIHRQGDDSGGLRDTSSDGEPRHCIARVDSGAIRFAPELKPGSTRFKTSSLLLDFDVPGPPPPDSDYDIPSTGTADNLAEVLRFSASMEAQDQPPFYPHLRLALANAGSVTRLTGTPTVESRVEIDGAYLRHGFNADNVGEIYLRFVDDKTKLAFSSNTANSGAFANASTVFAAASRINGPIGGAGELEQDRALYRHEPTDKQVQSNDVAGAPTTPQDPVAKARKGTADPREFFGKTLAEAKLCGVVAFADIIDSFAQAAGARAPQIREALEHTVSGPLLGSIANTVRKALQPLLNILTDPKGKSLHAPAMLAAAQALDGKLAQVPNTNGVALLQLTSEIVEAGESLREQVRTAVESPANLLPPDMLERVKALQTLSQGWRGFLQEGPIQQFKNNMLAELGVNGALQRLDTLKVTLEQTVKGDPRYKALGAPVEQLQASFGALQEAARQAPQVFITNLREKLVPVLAALDDFAGWCSWLATESQDVQTTLGAVKGRIIATIDPSKLVAKTQVLKGEGDRLKRELANAHPVADQAILQLSEIVLAAIANAEALKAKLRHYKESATNDNRRIADELFSDLLRFSQESLGKVARLLELKDELDRIAPVQSGEFQGVYLELLREVVDQTHLQSLLDSATTLPSQVSSISTQVASVTKLLNQLHGATTFATLTEILPAYAALIRFNDLLVAALDPQEAIRSALTQYQDLAENQLFQALGKACSKLQEVVGAIALPDKAELDDIQAWLSPTLRTRIDSLRPMLARLDGPVDGTRAGVTTFLEFFDKARVGLTSLIEDVARMISTGDISALVDIQSVLDKALSDIGLPTKARLNYDWDTRVNAYPAGSNPIFEPQGEGRLTVHSLIEADLRGKSTPTFSLEARLDPFAINLFGAAPFLSILFKPLSFSVGTGREAKLDVDIDKVDFKGALTFVKSLQQYLQEKFGIVVEQRKQGPGVVVGYSFSKDLITLTAFTLQMVSFNITCELPFDSEPARFRFGLSRPDQPFLISAGIYGGGGHVAIQSRADTLEALDASFEYGVVTAFQFGLAVGRGRITAGIYIRLSAREATLSGYFNASGVANIAGLVTVSAQFRVQLWYDLKSGRTAGAATFSISFSIGFFDYEYDVDVAYASQGDSEKNKNAEDKRASALLLSVPAALSDQDLSSEETRVAIAKNRIASKIAPSSFQQDSDCLLHPPVWQAYWAAFEDPFDGCE